ncbi:MAG: NAD-dependent epimerase/dehydratase family protein [Chitinophagia bacterium]|nr:NAD-dependent epimerase/dehydratase family protein [Chitinophagia bacterium]
MSLYLCEYYLKLNYEVTVIDNLSTSSINNINAFDKNFIFIEGDITDIELVNNLVSKTDLVIHLAAAVGVKTILSKPIESITTNFLGSEIILTACAKFDKRILIASTSEIYGKNLTQPLSEEDDRVVGPPQILRWSYADAKALEESLAHALYLSKQLKVTTVRFFNTVGPRQSSKYGMVLPNFIEKAREDLPLIIHGDGSQTRVFCHVNDAIEAVTKLLESNAAIGEVYNIGGVEEISILNLAHKVKKILNSNSEILFESYDKVFGDTFEDMIRRTPNINKIQQLIGWKPSYDLSQIIMDIHKSMI